MRQGWQLPLLCLLIGWVQGLPSGPPVYNVRSQPIIQGEEADDNGNGVGEMFDRILKANEAFDTEVIEGDIKFSEDETDTDESGGRYVRSALRDHRKLWTDGKIPYIVSGGMDYELQHYVRRAIDQIESVTCISFHRKLPTETDYVKFYDGDGCWSWVGKRKGQQKISLSSHGCKSQGIAMHEILHAVGFWHEQARPDRDNYINIVWNNIKSNARGNFKARTLGEAQMFTDYDFESIMHYSSKAFSRTGKVTIEPKTGFPAAKLGQRDHLTEKDIEGVNRLYGCTKTTRGGKPIIFKDIDKTKFEPTSKELLTNETTPNATSSTVTWKSSAKSTPATPPITKMEYGTWLNWSQFSPCSPYCSRTRVRMCTKKRPYACGAGHREEKQRQGEECDDYPGCGYYYYGR